MLNFGFFDLHPTTRRLLLARALRSIGQGTLVVDFALYLNAMHWSGVAIGLVLTGGGLFGAIISLLIGTTSDRLRRKPFLLAYESIALLASLAALVTARPAVLATAAIFGGFGRGANGAAGPFSPAEQAWLAEQVAPGRRGRIYSLNSALGFFGMSLGAILAILPSIWKDLLRGALAYRPLFLLVALASSLNLIIMFRAEEAYRGPQRGMNPQEKQVEKKIREQENRILAKLVSINAFNGLAVGLTGPLISYWFALRFSVGPVEIAPMMAAAFLLTGLSSLLTGRLTRSIGIVQSVVWGRLAGLALLILLPFMPIYWMAALMYLLRSAFNRGTAGARQALAVGLVRNERRGLSTSLNAVSFQLPQSVGPSIVGVLLDAGQLAVPFYAAAIFQGIYLFLYGRTFRNFEPPREDEDVLKESQGPDQFERRGSAQRQHGASGLKHRDHNWGT